MRPLHRLSRVVSLAVLALLAAAPAAHAQSPSSAAGPPASDRCARYLPQPHDGIEESGTPASATGGLCTFPTIDPATVLPAKLFDIAAFAPFYARDELADWVFSSSPPPPQAFTEIIGQFWQPGVTLDKAAASKLRAFAKRNDAVIVGKGTRITAGDYDLFGMLLNGSPPTSAAKDTGVGYTLTFDPDGSTANNLPVTLPSSANILQGAQASVYAVIAAGLPPFLTEGDRGPEATGGQDVYTDGLGFVVILSEDPAAAIFLAPSGMVGPSFRMNSEYDLVGSSPLLDVTAAPGAPLALFPVSGSLPGLVGCARLDLILETVTIDGQAYASQERLVFALPPETLPASVTADLTTTEGTNQLAFSALQVEALPDGAYAITFGARTDGWHVLQSIAFHDPGLADLTEVSAGVMRDLALDLAGLNVGTTAGTIGDPACGGA